MDLHLDESDAWVCADSVELHQILLNLGTNALHAMQGTGGELQFRTAWRSAGCLAVEVQDQGTGMDEATLARAFEPFFTTKPEEVGTGLGLAMSRRIAEGLGGTLTLRSHAGEGTCAELLLPAGPDPETLRPLGA
jgi:signal transduction histidine kinase